MNIKELVFHVFHPFTITKSTNTGLKKIGSLTTNQKIVSIAAFFIGLAFAGIGGPIAFYSTAYFFRNRKITQENPAKTAEIGQRAIQKNRIEERLKNGPPIVFDDEFINFEDWTSAELDTIVFYITKEQARSFNKHNEKFEVLQKISERGSPAAMLECAKLLLWGDPEKMPPNPNEAFSWFEKLANFEGADSKIRAEAYEFLARMYINELSEVIPEDPQKALEMAQNALTLGGFVYMGDSILSPAAYNTQKAKNPNYLEEFVQNALKVNRNKKASKKNHA